MFNHQYHFMPHVYKNGRIVSRVFIFICQYTTAGMKEFYQYLAPVDKEQGKKADAIHP